MRQGVTTINLENTAFFEVVTTSHMLFLSGCFRKIILYHTFTNLWHKEIPVKYINKGIFTCDCDKSLKKPLFSRFFRVTRKKKVCKGCDK